MRFLIDTWTSQNEDAVELPATTVLAAKEKFVQRIITSGFKLGAPVKVISLFWNQVCGIYLIY